MVKHKYRIVRDNYCGYEAQVKYWYWPFSWVQLQGTNTHLTADLAEAYINKFRQPVVKYVD